MKVTIDKNYTAVNQVAATKQVANVFKNYFTENDLLRMFVEATDSDISGTILKCEVEAFPNSIIAFGYGFRVELYVFNSIRFYEVGFYVNYDGNQFVIDQEPLLMTCNEFSKIRN